MDIKGKILCFIVVLLGFLSGPARVIAVVDPLVMTNNKIGIHVLDSSEIIEAKKLVNGESGAWGYVTVPIQATDRDRIKWSRFMKEAKQEKVIPIIRVATVVSGSDWDEPNNYDLVDFANFLNDLPWPTKNRYVVIFNEVNRADEYGGFVSPGEYADILVNAITIFKERNEDFFILPAGLDNAASSNGSSLRWDRYWEQVFAKRPEIPERLDGWVSHSYPNYGFRGSPYDRHDHSIAGYLSELRLLSRYTKKKLPVFITETGWDMEVVSSDKAAEYLRLSYEKVWSETQVVAVTPFLLRAGAGPFVKFSFLDQNGQPRPVYKVWQSLAVQGNPELGQESDWVVKIGGKGVSLEPVSRSIREQVSGVNWEEIWRWLQRVFGLEKTRIMSEGELVVGDRSYKVEIAETEREKVDGLSGRSRLRPDEGMLFLFEPAEKPIFWMKGMIFDIDIVWVVDGKVIQVDAADRVQINKRYGSKQPVEMVLEVAVGSGIKVGDGVSRL